MFWGGKRRRLAGIRQEVTDKSGHSQLEIDSGWAGSNFQAESRPDKLALLWVWMEWRQVQPGSAARSSLGEGGQGRDSPRGHCAH